MSHVSARTTDVHYLRVLAATTGHQPSIDPPLTVSEANRRRHEIVMMPSTTENIGHRALSAVSQQTSPDDQPTSRRPRPLHPGRHASTLPTGVTAASTWTRSNAADTRPHKVSRSLTCRPTHGASSSGELWLAHSGVEVVKKWPTFFSPARATKSRRRHFVDFDFDTGMTVSWCAIH